MKKVVSLVICLLLIIGIVPISASAETTSITQDGIEYVIDTATGEAEVDDADSGIVTAEITSEINGYPVTSIGYSAFWNCTSLTSVTIPDSVTSIGYSAFWNCTSLTEITIGNGVTSIGWGAFYNTAYYNDETNWENGVLYLGNYLIKAKTDISGKYTIKDGTKLIADEAFEDCTSLTEITIPDSVTSIGDEAFYNTAYYNDETNWENGVLYIGDFLIDAQKTHYDENYNNIVDLEVKGEYTIKDGTKLIAESAFEDCTSLTSVTIPDSVTSIGYEAFSVCTSLTSVTIPDSVTSIGGGAFMECTSLTSVTIPDSVTSIGGWAFEGCTSLTSITIGGGVTSIGDWAFWNCTSLTEINVDENNQNYCSENGVLFTKDKTELIQYPAGKSDTSYAIPDSVTSIGGYAFSWCESLTSITIPNSVTSIGVGSFWNCTSLTSVTIPDSVTSIGNSAFSGCTSLTEITIPDSVTSIDRYAFSGCTSLTSVTIPDSVTSIGWGAFEDCTSLTEVTIGGSVTSIGYEAFGYYYDYDNWETQKIENFTIYGYTGSAAETYANENGFTFIDVENMPEKPTTQGDLNGDGKVSVADARSMLFAIAGGNADNQDTAIADFNGDGKLTVVDVRLLLVKIANGEV